MPEIRSQADELARVRAKLQPPSVDQRFAALENAQSRTMLAVEALVARKDSADRRDDDKRDDRRRYDDDDDARFDRIGRMISDAVAREFDRRDKAKRDEAAAGEPEPMASDDDRHDDGGDIDPEHEDVRASREKAEPEQQEQVEDDRRDRRGRHDTRADAAAYRRQEERDELDLYEAKGQYDEAFRAMDGTEAPRASDGMKPRTYRLMCAKRLQKYCDDWKNVDLAKLAKTNPDAFALADTKIRADAIRIGSTPSELQKYKSDGNLLREIRRQDRTGRWISEFVGPIDAPNGAMAPFRMPPFRVLGINPTPNDPRTWR